VTALAGAAAVLGIVAGPAGAVSIRIPRVSPPRVAVRPPPEMSASALRDALEGARPALRERLDTSVAEVTPLVEKQKRLRDCLADAAQEATQDFVTAAAEGQAVDYDALQAAGFSGCVQSVFPDELQPQVGRVADALTGQADEVADDALQGVPPAGSDPPLGTGGGGSSFDGGGDSGSSFPVGAVVVVVVVVGGAAFFFARRRPG
jgi:hypothetical protein